MCSKWRLKSLGGWMAQHLQARLVSPRACLWLKMEGTSDLCGVFAHSVSMAPFPLHQPPGYGLGGMLTQIRIRCGPGYTRQTFFFFLIRLCQVLVVACGISCCSSWTLRLWYMGSMVVARGLSCCVAHGILVSQSGTEPASPALQGGFLTTGLPGTSPLSRIWSLGLHRRTEYSCFHSYPILPPGETVY